MKRSFVRVEKPLRIDLAGGWSDTPPICYEMGGCVLNAAVTLEGVQPVVAEVARIDAAEVRVESVDLGRRGVLRTTEELHDHGDPHDWLALVKSALTVVGYAFEEGGLEIRISAAVPKGSGMGTSSILGAALVEALCRVRGGKSSWQSISDLVLNLEQEMQTGGGWEDQAGALVPGVKLLETRKGPVQRIKATRLAADAEAAFAKFLEERALLYFTGRKRMARNVLRGVLNFFKENPDGLAVEIIQALKADAAESFAALRRRDYDCFCAVLNRYWLNKKALDPGSTNPIVESIIARIAPWTSAVSLCGAGGGGFMLIVTRSAEARAKLRASLERHPPVRYARFYDFALLSDAGDGRVRVAGRK